MVLFDYSQILISAFFSQGVLKSPDEDLIRHVTLNTLRSHAQKFSGEFGQPVVCADGKNTWRKQFFPYYKASRVKTREASDVDWKALFDTMTKIYNEIDSIPLYPCIRLDETEADDIIAILSEISYRNSEKTVIISSDHDFAQLQRYEGISQYSPGKNTFVRESDPIGYLYEHIGFGDSSDGIPNIFSDDDTFVNGSKRQVPATKKRMQLLIDSIYTGKNLSEVFPESVKRNWDRNNVLINFEHIPGYIRDRIKETYHEKISRRCDKKGFYDYLIEHRLRELLKCMHEFF